MRIPRIYQPGNITPGEVLELCDDAANHVGRVLRMQAGQKLILFNGTGYDATAVIKPAAKKKQVQVQVLDRVAVENESPLRIHLGQVISRGDRMDFTLQKSVELGVDAITPLVSERCGVRLNSERMEKKVQQWQKIVQAACEQSGRSYVPRVYPVQQLTDWCSEPSLDSKLTLHPRAKYSISTLPRPEHGLRLLIGPEGGLSDEEIKHTVCQGFIETLLGPRVLRTETAALSAITALQCRFGDLG